MSPFILCDGASSLYGEDNGRTYHKCGRCGFMFVHPHPGEQEVPEFYDGESGMTFHRSADQERDDEGKYEALLRYRLLKPYLDRCPTGYQFARRFEKLERPRTCLDVIIPGHPEYCGENGISILYSRV